MDTTPFFDALNELRSHQLLFEAVIEEVVIVEEDRDGLWQAVVRVPLPGII